MKAPSREASPRSVLCKQHKEKYVFVCLHKTCALAFKIGCIRCRKEHAQHPNRLLSLNDFHTLLSKPITYLQTETAFKLLNLKKKVEYIRNFRTQILQKEMDLMASNRGIKSTVSAIREQHYLIRDVMSHIDPEGLNNNFEQYLHCLQQSKQFMTYNPIKGDITFNNQIIKTSRVQLEKYLQKSQELIGHIREFLVKIIEVLLANCTHDEDDEDIEYAEEGCNPANFNIIIKNRTEASQNPNIKNKIQHRDFLEIFDEEKEAMTKEVEMLEKEVDDKNTILHKIKSAHSMMGSQICEKSEEEDGEKNWFSKTAMQSLNFKKTFSKEKIDELKQCDDDLHLREKQTETGKNIREQYQAIISSKNEQISELKNICHQLEEKINIISIANQNSCQFEKVTMEQLQKEKALSHTLTKTIKQLQLKINPLNDTIAKMTNQQRILVQKMTSAESQFQKKFIEQERQKAEVKNKKEETSKTVSQLKVKFDKMVEQMSAKQKELQQQMIKSANLQKMIGTVKQQSSKMVLKLQNDKIDAVNRQQSLKSQLKKVRDELQNTNIKLKQQKDKNKLLQNKIKQISKTSENKDAYLQKIQKDFKRQLSQKVKSSASMERGKELQIEPNISKCIQTLKGSQQQSKKYKETKGLLQVSIKKNQELKDRNHSLQLELQSIKTFYKQQQQKKNNSKVNDKKKTENINTYHSQKKKLEHMEKSQNNESVNSEQLVKPPHKGEPLGQRNIFNNKAERKQAYLEIKNIFKTVTEDMTVLEERLKQNTVIEKVYLKELERKRNENKILKKELQNFKIYGASKYTEAFRLASQTSLCENKEKIDQSSSSQLNHNPKESQLLTAKKYMKANGK